MAAAAARKDELLTDLLERVKSVEGTLSDVKESLARIEQSEEQARSLASQAIIRMDALDARLTALEAARNRAEGAAAGMNWLWRALIAAGLVGGGAAASRWMGK